MSLSRFQGALGEPGVGVHSHVAGIAIVDVALSVAAAYYLSKYAGVRFPPALLGVFGAGVVAHRIFGVRTKVDRILFP